MKKMSKISIAIVIVCVLAIVAVFLKSVFTMIGNQDIIDTNFTYTKAYITMGNEVKEIEISQWRDYADGEQIQITDKDGNVYLVSSLNCVLINEK